MLLTKSAAQVRQGELTLYATALTVAELISPGFYSVETLDPAGTESKGFQRLLNKARAKKLADYILKGQDAQDAFLPTSVFLATDQNIPFDTTTGTIDINAETTGPFSVVDGQHRLEGLKLAAQKDPRVLGFEVPVNIAVNLPYISQMCHFLIVNTTQKSVDKSVEQRIISRLTEALNVEDMPTLPKWIQQIVQTGDVDKAVKLVDYLNITPGSPWKDRVKIANDRTRGKSIAQRSFVTAIVKYVLTANNPISALGDFEKEKKVFLNYWIALSNTLDDGNAAVLYKYNGVELFCRFSIPFFVRLQEHMNFTIEKMTTELEDCFENLEGDYAGAGHPEWWHSGSSASFLNSGAINRVYQEMTKALHKRSMGGGIEL